MAALTRLFFRVSSLKEISETPYIYLVFEVVWKNLRDTFRFVFEVHNWKHFRDLLPCFWRSLKKSGRCFCVLFVKSFERILGAPCVWFLKYIYSLKERELLRFYFCSSFKESLGPFVSGFWSTLEKISWTPCVSFLK